MEDNIVGGGGSVFDSIGRAQLKKIKIPLPPLEVQERIVSELDGYQKVIDGARQVVEHYRPHIDIDPNWEMVELGEVCELNPRKSQIKQRKEDLEVSFVPMEDIHENQMNFNPKQEKKLGEVYKGYTYFEEGDVLLAKVTPCFENGKAGLASGLKNKIGFGSSELYVLRAGKKVRPEWIYYNIITPTFRDAGKTNMTGTGGLQRVPKDFVSKWLIPCPDLEIQDQAIEKIRSEQEIINSNKLLMDRYTRKIDDRIARVWGTDK